jgi:hypothetical protein
VWVIGLKPSRLTDIFVRAFTDMQKSFLTRTQAFRPSSSAYSCSQTTDATVAAPLFFLTVKKISSLHFFLPDLPPLCAVSNEGQNGFGAGWVPQRLPRRISGLHKLRGFATLAFATGNMGASSHFALLPLTGLSYLSHSFRCNLSGTVTAFGFRSLRLMWNRQRIRTISSCPFCQPAPSRQRS